MIEILDERTQGFLEFLNKNYGTEQKCVLSVLNCQDTVCEKDDGKEMQSCFIPWLDQIVLTTCNPPDGIYDHKGKLAPKWYEDNYSLLKLAHEYAHFLQKYGKLPDPEDIDENEDIADKFSHKVVKEFIATE